MRKLCVLQRQTHSLARRARTGVLICHKVRILLQFIADFGPLIFRIDSGWPNHAELPDRLNECALPALA